jgi:uncharacterized OsmC-like protein
MPEQVGDLPHDRGKEPNMNAEQLRARQAPVKEQYKKDASAAVVTMQAKGTLDPASLTCRVETFAGPVTAGLHPAAGGDGIRACSGDMLLQALVACAGVTLTAVATALGINLRGGTITAEGQMDFRGTLGISRDTPVGFKSIRLDFKLDSDASADQIAKLLQLTERYCVIYQTLRQPPEIIIGH